VSDIDPERFRLTGDLAKPVMRRAKRKRVPFAQVPLDCLTDRQGDAIFPPRTRLWLYLLIKSRAGRNSVRLTNPKVAEIGLDRHAKSRALAQLRRAGLVSVVQQGSEAPIVNVMTRAGPEPDVA
jgi:hypothetical protein